MLVFGGYSGQKFENSDLNIIEMDQQKTRLMIKESNARGLKIQSNVAFENRQSMVIQASDLKNDATLKVFSMDMTNHQNQNFNEDDHKKKLQKDNEIERLSFQHFKSFLPLPIRETSTLLKEFKLKKDLNEQQKI